MSFFLSIVIPKIVNSLEFSSIILSNFIGSLNTFFLFVIVIYWVLDGLKVTLLFLPQMLIISKSMFMSVIVFTLVASISRLLGFLLKVEVECNVQSSAKACSSLVVDVSRSLINIMNSVGDKTQPCGTPALVVWTVDEAPSTATKKFLSVK
jgi:hypothetical protein